MAVVAENLASTLTVKVEADVKPDGSTVYASRSIPKINPALTNEDAYDLASSFGTLQSCPVGDIERTNRMILSRA